MAELKNGVGDPARLLKSISTETLDQLAAATIDPLNTTDVERNWHREWGNDFGNSFRLGPSVSVLRPKK